MADESKGKRRAPQGGEAAAGGKGAVTPESAAAAAPAPEDDQPQSQHVQQARDQYLVTTVPGQLLPMGIQPLSLDVVQKALEMDPDIEVKRTLATRDALGILSEGAGQPAGVVVAEMSPERADVLGQQPQLVIERDLPLSYSLPVVPPTTVPDPGVVTPFGDPFPVSFHVTGSDGRPLEGANVYVFGAIWPAQGVTDAGGRVQLNLLGENPQSLQGLYVNPRAEHWSLWLARPILEPGRTYEVALHPLNASFPGFPKQQVLGWGQRAMRLHEVPAAFRGQNVKVAVIDSGAAVTHSDLERIRFGRDTTQDNDQTWVQDTIAHGSHCAGVIAGLDNDTGVRGFAPEAEMHVCKIFPGGRFSNLIDSIDYCIQNQIDVANLSLGSDDRSELVEQKLRQAKEMGIALIVAAGNSSGPVKYPASSQHVLSVAAVGKLGEFPSDSYHSTQALAGGPIADGWFSARFSCFGPEVDVCAPGVAILSTVPPDVYAVWDGTSMAAPHVTGLAALVLAHHPDFQGPFRARNALRVERLFQILKESARPVQLGDPGRTGAGVPDAVRALAPAIQATPQFAAAGAASGVSPEVIASLERLRGALAQASAAGAAGRQASTQFQPMGAATPPAASAGYVGWAMGELLALLQKANVNA